MTYFTDEEKSKSIFHLLVKDESDFIGMMAYAEYKQSKAEYIENHRISKNNEKPSEEELKRFQNALCEDEAVKKFRDIGQKKMLEIFNNMFKDKVADLNKELLEKQKKLDLELKDAKSLKEQISKKEAEIKESDKGLKKKIKEFENREKYCKAVHPRGFWNGVVQSICASFLFLVATIIISLGLVLNTNIVEIITNMVSK